MNLAADRVKCDYNAKESLLPDKQITIFIGFTYRRKARWDLVPISADLRDAFGWPPLWPWFDPGASIRRLCRRRRTVVPDLVTVIPNLNRYRARCVIVAAAAVRARSAFPFPVPRHPFAAAAIPVAFHKRKTGPVSNFGRPAMVALISGIAYVRTTIRVRLSVVELVPKPVIFGLKLVDFVLQGRLVANFVTSIAALAALAALRSITLLGVVPEMTAVVTVITKRAAAMAVVASIMMTAVMGMVAVMLVTVAVMLVMLSVVTMVAAILVIDRLAEPLVRPIVAAPFQPIV